MESLQEKIARLKGKYQAERPTFSTKQLFLTKNNPTAVIRIIPEGEDLFPLIGIHTVNKTDGKFSTYLCPTLTMQKATGFIDDNTECVLCDAIAQVNDSKLTSRAVAKLRVALKVIHYENQEDPEHPGTRSLVPIDIKYTLLTTDVADQLLDYIAENPEVISPQAGILLTMTKDYSTKYPTYIFDVYRTPTQGIYNIDLTSAGAKEFIKNNDIKIEDAVYAATKEDLNSVGFGESTGFEPPIDNKIIEKPATNTQVGFVNPPDVNTANGKNKTSLDAFKNKLLNYK